MRLKKKNSKKKAFSSEILKYLSICIRLKKLSKSEIIPLIQ